MTTELRELPIGNLDEHSDLAIESDIEQEQIPNQMVRRRPNLRQHYGEAGNSCKEEQGLLRYNNGLDHMWSKRGSGIPDRTVMNPRKNQQLFLPTVLQDRG